MALTVLSKDSSLGVLPGDMSTEVQKPRSRGFFLGRSPADLGPHGLEACAQSHFLGPKACVALRAKRFAPSAKRVASRCEPPSLGLAAEGFAAKAFNVASKAKGFGVRSKKRCAQGCRAWRASLFALRAKLFARQAEINALRTSPHAEFATLAAPSLAIHAPQGSHDQAQAAFHQGEDTPSMQDEHFPAARRAFRWLAMAALAPLLSLTLTCSAAPSTTAGTSPTATTAPIAVADILTRADEDQQRVDQARRLLAAPDPAEALGRALDDIARPVDAKQRIATGGGLRALPVMRLESLERHWAFDTWRFDRWEAQARRELAPYADSALQLAQRRAAWSATRAEGLLNDLPPAMSTRVDDMIRQIDASEAALGTALARQFALKQRASELKARIQAGDAEVAAAIDDIDRRLLQADAPPLWQGVNLHQRPQDTWAVLNQGMEIERQFALDYRAFGHGNQRVLSVV
jgi:hypothetical protein